MKEVTKKELIEPLVSIFLGAIDVYLSPAWSSYFGQPLLVPPVTTTYTFVKVVGKALGPISAYKTERLLKHLRENLTDSDIEGLKEWERKINEDPKLREEVMLSIIFYIDKIDNPKKCSLHAEILIAFWRKEIDQRELLSLQKAVVACNLDSLDKFTADKSKYNGEAVKLIDETDGVTHDLFLSGLLHSSGTEALFDNPNSLIVSPLGRQYLKITRSRLSS